MSYFGLLLTKGYRNLGKCVTDKGGLGERIKATIFLVVM